MASNNDTAAWVESRMASLNYPGEPQADPAHAWAQLAGRRRRKAAIHRSVWVASVAAAVCLLLAAFPAPRVLAARCVSACAIVLANFSQPSPASRLMAPDFVLPDASGSPVRLSDYRGKVVLLNFWATWCDPCQREIPWFIEFQRSYRDFIVLGVALDDDGWRSVQPFAAKMQMNYRLLIGSAELARLYGGLHAVPTTFVIDRSGRIAAFHIGLVPKTEYQAEIRSALEENQHEH